MEARTSRILNVIAIISIILLSGSIYNKHRQIKYYELSLKTIAEDMKINYALHQGAIEQLRMCSNFDKLAK